jgi:LmbE family N-acetylglucosaminyl deacetylase
MVKMRTMRWIYISPHLDDAVLSAGGLIYEQTQAETPVEIWTVMSGIPEETELSMFAQVNHYIWGTTTAEHTLTLRRAEDAEAAHRVGAKAVHFDFLDCIYRRGANGDWLYNDVFVPPHMDDMGLPRQIAETLSSRLKSDDKLVCQLGLGSHVDHVLVRQAAEMLGRPLLYLADIPYLFKHPESLGPYTAGMKENVEPVTETGLRSWQDAVDSYVSQLSSLLESPENLRESIMRYWAVRRGITLYLPE